MNFGMPADRERIPAREYEAKLIAEYVALLPETPPWKK